jgi:hypothetical protein
LTLVPRRPLSENRFHQIRIDGGVSGLTGADGQPVDGDGDGSSGGDFVVSLGQGTSLKYLDAHRNLVKLTLTQGGWMELVRTPDGDGERLLLGGIQPRRTTLSATLRRRGLGATGQTRIGVIDGAGRFGDVIFRMKSPPILIGSVTPGGVTALLSSRKRG